jgi:hypothetical protein
MSIYPWESALPATADLSQCVNPGYSALRRNLRHDFLGVGDKLFTDPIDLAAAQFITADNATKCKAGDNTATAAAKSYSCGSAQCDQQPSPRS